MGWVFAKNSMKELKVYPCGTMITTKLGAVQGMITCQSIRFRRVSYEITFDSNGKPDVFWASEHEFDTEAAKEVIGFKFKNKNGK